MQAQYIDQVWLKLDTILDIKRFWLNKMIRLGKSLTILDIKRFWLN